MPHCLPRSAKNRAIMQAARAKLEKRCWTRLNWLINMMLLEENIEGIMQRVVEVLRMERFC